MASPNVSVKVGIDISDIGAGVAKVGGALDDLSKGARRAMEGTRVFADAITALGGASTTTGRALGTLLSGFASGGAMGLAIAGVQALIGYVKDVKKEAEEAAQNSEKLVRSIEKSVALRTRQLALAQATSPVEAARLSQAASEASEQEEIGRQYDEVAAKLEDAEKRKRDIIATTSAARLAESEALKRVNEEISRYRRTLTELERSLQTVSKTGEAVVGKAASEEAKQRAREEEERRKRREAAIAAGRQEMDRVSRELEAERLRALGPYGAQAADIFSEINSLKAQSQALKEYFGVLPQVGLLIGRLDKNATILGDKMARLRRTAEEVARVKTLAGAEAAADDGSWEADVQGGWVAPPISFPQELQRQFEDLADKWASVLQPMTSAFQNFVSNVIYNGQSMAESLNQLFKQILASYISMLIQMAMTRLAFAIAGAFMGGAPALAAGGGVMPPGLGLGTPALSLGPMSAGGTTFNINALDSKSFFDALSRNDEAVKTVFNNLSRNRRM